MSDQHSIQLQTGKLQISVFSTKFSLDHLLTFGSRLNPKRRFLFVSKVLGKYVPCQPSTIRKSYQMLARQIQPLISPSSDTWVLGIAETATGLAAGVAQEIKVYGDTQQIVYSHTTRCQIDKEIEFSIIEAHSHAPSHLIYSLEKPLNQQSITTAVLVDDEISTGNTLAQLTNKLLERLPLLKTVVWASLVNWVSLEDRAVFAEKYPNIRLLFCSLLDGDFEFIADETFKDELPKNTAVGISKAVSRADIGRTGYLVQKRPQYSFVGIETNCAISLQQDQQYTVVGTGEFSYLPFLFAEELEQRGFDILFQSTGRSPAIEDCGIKSKISCFDNGHQGMFYLYNLPKNRQVILCYENKEQYYNCPFKDILDAKVVILDTFLSNT